MSTTELGAWRTHANVHTMDPTEPRECECGMSWPCALGDALNALAAAEREHDAARAVIAKVAAVREEVNTRYAGDSLHSWWVVDQLDAALATPPAPGGTE